MGKEMKLGKLEKSTAGLVFNTGIVDIGIGMIFVVISLAMIFDDIRYYIDIALILPPIFIYLCVKFIVQPRMGVIKPTPRRVKRSMMMITTITIFLVVMVTMTYFGGGNSVSDIINPRWIISGIIFFICIAIAFFLSFNRMYLYSLLYVGAFNFSEILRENPGILPSNGYAYMIASAILIAIGIFYFIKFLMDYPLPEEGVDYEG